MKIRVKSVRCLAGLALCALITLSAATAGATEGGGGTYPNGAEGVMAGALPPPGLYYLNYLTHYSADQLNDKNGNKQPVDFHVNVTANVSRFVYMTNYQLLGANYGMYALVPLINGSGTLGTPGGNSSSTKSGVGDISFSPFVLAWHSKNWHAATGFEITAPTGQYDKNRLVNLGRNYWTIQPIFTGTLLSDNGLELSGKFMYDFNTENTDTKYTSGQEFHFDYAAAYHTGPWTMGATGYFYKQVSDDHGAGAAANDGNKGQVFAIGPTVKYDYKNMSIEAKYQKEMLVENKPEGDKYWVKVIWAF
ncbi:hypothetical protein FO488_05695 [Geobacter sp. FeAm09]|uniref:SphA family protein n=1 Tax=Geobacter sp. FeAm09 TaxID=2597769 RepID=UPI0011EFA2FA|nr:transporter [Geobacter sp. FeAm09]QEM67695.1 hypothetical protein FO488_05695 [Geobacter sp. FeAm09]